MDSAAVKKLIENNYGDVSFEIDRLAGDASDRSFHRIKFHGNSSSGVPASAVMMVLGAPESDPDIPFLNVASFMRKAGLPVPEIFVVDLAAGLILMEDFGDATLEDAVRVASPSAVENLYKKAVDLMLDIQLNGTRLKNDSCVAFKLAFDVEKLIFEFNFFKEHALLGYKNAKLSNAEEEFINKGFMHVAETLSAQPRYLTHRDYHSRNIMAFSSGGLGLVDFQDARLGPLQYDLVSLLLDSYVELPEGLVSTLKDYYVDRLTERAGEEPDRAHFDLIYDYMAFQRCVKAAGSFAFLDCVKNKNRYLKYFAPCLSKARAAAAERPELAALLDAISVYVEELRQP
jgi:hypothetical protein